MNIRIDHAHPNNYNDNKPAPIGVMMHWIVGTAESAVKHFQNPRSRVSAHYVIGDEDIIETVPTDKIAYHAGSWENNLTLIGIEHEGGWQLADGNRQHPSKSTHDTSAWLMAQLSKQFDWGELKLDKNVFRHNRHRKTECPGTLDVEYIIQEANKILQSDKSNTMTLEESKIMIDAYCKERARNDKITDRREKYHVDVNHWANLYLSTPAKRSVFDGLNANIDDIMKKQGFTHYELAKRIFQKGYSKDCSNIKNDIATALEAIVNDLRK